MPPKKMNSSRSFIVWIIAGLIALGIGSFLWMAKKPTVFQKKNAAPQQAGVPEKTPLPSESSAVIDYQKLKTDDQTKTLMQERKSEYGVGQGIDMIAKPGESVKVGDTTVPMKEILDQIKLKQGDIIENTIEPDGSIRPSEGGAYGIHVVQTNDNIWNIHYDFLKGYFKTKGITLSRAADEPNNRGISSGIGKVLKFSENMVHIYNLKEKKLDTDLNMIHPLEKIVVYNMDQVFALLDQVDYAHINRLQFDGEALWIPAQQ